jgi:hypothetical protein
VIPLFTSADHEHEGHILRDSRSGITLNILCLISLKIYGSLNLVSVMNLTVDDI